MKAVPPMRLYAERAQERARTDEKGGLIGAFGIFITRFISIQPKSKLRRGRRIWPVELLDQLQHALCHFSDLRRCEHRKIQQLHQ